MTTTTPDNVIPDFHARRNSPASEQVLAHLDGMADCGHGASAGTTKLLVAEVRRLRAELDGKAVRP
jgi:hypothetical protein